MLTRLVALAVVGGLGVGLVLRIWLGRGRFALLATLAVLPVTAHAVHTFVDGLGRGVGVGVAATFLGGALAIVVAGALLGRRSVPTRPWLAVLAPVLTAAAYGAAPLLLYWVVARAVVPRFDVLVLAGMVTATIFLACALVSFAPPPLAASERGSSLWRRR